MESTLGLGSFIGDSSVLSRLLEDLSFLWVFWDIFDFCDF